MEDESKQFFAALSEEDRSAILQRDPVLSLFDAATVLTISEGNLGGFNLDKINDAQDNLEKSSYKNDSILATIVELLTADKKSPNVLNRKLSNIIAKRLVEISKDKGASIPPAASASKSGGADSAPKDSHIQDYISFNQPVKYEFTDVVLRSGGTINVRDQPNEAAEVVTSCDQSSEIWAVGKQNHWLKVEIEGGEAWLSSYSKQVGALLQPVKPSKSSAAPTSVKTTTTTNVESGLVSNLGLIKQQQSRHQQPEEPPQSQATSYSPPPTNHSEVMRQPQHQPLPQYTHNEFEFTDHSHRHVSPNQSFEYSMSSQMMMPPAVPHQQRSGMRYVSYEEHNRLHQRVAELERDLVSLKSLLRSV